MLTNRSILLAATLAFFTAVIIAGSDIPCAPRFGDSGFVCVCNATYCDTFTYPSRSTENFTHIFTSNHTPGYNFRWGPVQNASSLPFSLSDQSITVKVNISNKSHRLKGIGGSFTDSFCINVKSLSEEAGNNLLRSYFSQSGSEYKMARVPIASSDFCTRTYTYDDSPGDVNLEYFKLAPEDYTYKIPVISAAKEMSPHNLNLFGSAWTSPNWTKADNSYTRGYMKKEYFGYWAEYLLRFLEEYKKEGIEFWGFSPFNEPINALYLKEFLINSMQWLPMAHRVFVRDHLGPLLRASPFNATKLLTFEDGRWFLEYWMDRVMVDTVAADYIDGVSLHWYRDTQSPPDLLDKMFKKYNKFILYTEACIILRLDPNSTLTVDLGSWIRGAAYAKDIIEVINHMSIGFIDWNMALNTEGGPVFPATGPVDSPVIVNASADEFYKNPMFYALGHFSKFIDEGSYRVDSTSEPSSSISHLATANPDGSISTFLYNPTWSDMTVILHDVINMKIMNISVKAESLNTIVWW